LLTIVFVAYQKRFFASGESRGQSRSHDINLAADMVESCMERKEKFQSATGLRAFLLGAHTKRRQVL